MMIDVPRAGFELTASGDITRKLPLFLFQEDRGLAWAWCFWILLPQHNSLSDLAGYV
jgi:hypothetical protein